MQKEAQQRSRWPGRVRLLVMRNQAAFEERGVRLLNERIVDQDSGAMEHLETGTWGFKTCVASLENW